MLQTSVANLNGTNMWQTMLQISEERIVSIFCRTLLLQNSVAHLSINPLLQTSVAHPATLQSPVANLFFKPLLETLAANRCWKPELQTFVANLCCKPLLQTMWRKQPDLDPGVKEHQF